MNYFMFFNLSLLHRISIRFTFLLVFLMVSPLLNQGQTPSTQPILRIETGTHAAMVNRIAVDAANRFLVTASADKTARVWDLSSGQLLRVLRPPIGVGSEGRLYSVAISPDGNKVAVGGWTGAEWDGTNSIYLFDRENGVLTNRITDIPNVINYLAYSPDGRYLAALVGSSDGIHLYRTGDYTECARDAGGELGVAMDFDSSSRRLATSDTDGFIRLYAIDETGALRLAVKRQTRVAKSPASLKFSPNGERIAVGFLDNRNIEVMSGSNLEYLYAPDTKPYDISRFPVVGWSADGKKLFATGSHPAKSLDVMIIGFRVWDEAGRGSYRDVEAAPTVVNHAVALANGGIVYGVADGSWGTIDAAGKRIRFVEPSITNNIGILDRFLLASDGTKVQFSYETFAKSLAQFSIRDRSLSFGTDKVHDLKPLRNQSKKIKITDWISSPEPKLNGRKLELEVNEKSTGYAIAPNDESFLLGTTFYLRAFNRDGQELWKTFTTVVVGVNISDDGRFAVAACNDGTIRWYRIKDGKELLAFLPHIDRRRWVLWTQSGYYDASTAGEELIGWHVNNGSSQAADFFPVGVFRDYYYRPDVIASVLETGDEIAAIKSANDKIKRSGSPPNIAKLLPPVIEIRALQTSAASGTSGKTVTVSYNVRTPSGEPVTGVKAVIDGRATNVVGETKSKTNATANEITLQVPERDCEITLIAENRFTKSVPAKLYLRRGELKSY
jgi:WD40 repeat protein